MVFARDLNDNVVSLITKLDAASKQKKVNSFVVFMNDEEKLEGQLKDLAKNKKINKTVLSIDNPAGPKGYKISKDAEVTVLLYNRRKVAVNEAFRKGELNTKAIDGVISKLDKIAP